MNLYLNIPTTLLNKPLLVRSILIFGALGCIASDVAFSVEVDPTAIPQMSDDSLQSEFDERVVSLLREHCFDCHSGSESEAGVDLTAYTSLEQIRGSESVWEQIRGLVRIGAMPPPEQGYDPSQEDRDAIAVWVQNALHYVDCSECQTPPPITIARLNAVQYDNTIRDLFGVDLKPSRKLAFVTDEVGNGFDNQGEVLTISPITLEKFLQAASYVAESVVVVDVESLRKQSHGGTLINRGKIFSTTFDLAAGRYELEARMEYGFQQNNTVDAELIVDGEVIKQVEVSPRRKSFKFEVDLEIGLHEVGVRFIDNEKAPEQLDSTHAIRIEAIESEGPKDATPRYPEVHRNIFIATVDGQTSVAQAAQQIADNFLPRCFRHPPEEMKRANFIGQIESEAAAGKSFEVAVQSAIATALISPEFLFRSERSTEITSNSDAVEAVEPYDLASRLSYFLWSSMPDQELLQLASDGSLVGDKILNEQVERMLQDAKIETGLVQQFFGQWLGLRNLQTAQMDTQQFPLFNESLRSAMRIETEMFCSDVLKNGKLLDLLAANHTFVNPRLAEFYGVQFQGRDPKELYRGRGRRRSESRDGRYDLEDQYERVTLDTTRRGLLTQASILTLTSNPTRTSPVKRGKWVLENIVGDPPPPAPPGVPTLEESGSEDMTLREQLALHRSNESCASCHKVMDPIGLGLESFDAIGRLRQSEGDTPIDSEGQLADGRSFNGPSELVTLLLDDEAKFAQHFSTKLLTYALGRGLIRQDACAIESIVSAAKPSQFELDEIIKAVVNCRPFRYRSTRLD